MELTPETTNFFLWAILVCQAFLGDLFPKGENLDQSKVKMSILLRGNNFDSKGGEKEEEVAKMGKNIGG